MNAPLPSPLGTPRARADRAADLLTDAVLALNSARLTRVAGTLDNAAALAQLAAFAREAAAEAEAGYAAAYLAAAGEA